MHHYSTVDSGATSNTLAHEIKLPLGSLDYIERIFIYRRKSGSMVINPSAATIATAPSA